jgi:hypothetical protein
MKRRSFLLAVLAGALALPAAAPAYHHSGVPADECAPSQAGEPGNNPRAGAAITEHNPAWTPPLPPTGTPSNAPTDCPAPKG